QRHDSMYLFLPFCMYFLFGGLLHIRGKRLAFLRDVSLVIYLIHPLVIVMLRPAARLLGLWELLVENSVVHFLMVGAISAVFAV
ncbi:acyltransferase family protein, partial [Escherichia coli]|uniref:acyltransferase family protein n=1 Tax=Escherichia coli TaxID=562 RepID=UPI00273A072D